MEHQPLLLHPFFFFSFLTSLSPHPVTISFSYFSFGCCFSYSPSFFIIFSLLVLAFVLLLISPFLYFYLYTSLTFQCRYSHRLCLRHFHRLHFCHHHRLHYYSYPLFLHLIYSFTSIIFFMPVFKSLSKQVLSFFHVPVSCFRYSFCYLSYFICFSLFSLHLSLLYYPRAPSRPFRPALSLSSLPSFRIFHPPLQPPPLAPLPPPPPQAVQDGVPRLDSFVARR